MKARWGRGKLNIWGEQSNFTIPIRRHREAAKYITTRLLQSDFDVSYAYQPLNHSGLAHAFLNTALYLDYDRKGWSWPMVPFQINCYGRLVSSYRRFISRLADRGRELDPPSPSPRRVFDLGSAVARICAESPWRVILIASSSWSRAFLVDKTRRMYPDVAFDRQLYQALAAGQRNLWRDHPLEKIEQSGNLFSSTKVTAIVAPERAHA